MVKVKESAPESVEQAQTSSGGSSGVGVSQSSSGSNNNGSRSRRRKGSPRKLSSSSVDNVDEGNPPQKKAKLETVEERGTAEGSGGGGAKGGGATGKEEIQAFTSAPLPLTTNSKVGVFVEYLY
ncbi:MAG: hypothetical protein MJE68_17345 [Proteobacteria bacterium]|nr:hypothetical protein [Pseudomonadota bacterium]